MAKLYWRVKRYGKWTWVAAKPDNTKFIHKIKKIVYTGPDEIYPTDNDLDIVGKPEVYTDDQ